MEISNQEKLYLEAVSICRESSSFGKIQRARDIFADFGDYKESADYLRRCDAVLGLKPGSKIEFGHYNDNPITWTVLDMVGTRMLVFADDAVAQMPVQKDRIGIDWNRCDLRKWLNKDFLNDAFDFKEKLRICISVVDNQDDERWSVENGPNTKDKLFILNQPEAEQYLPEQAMRASGQWWWLRGHGITSDLAQKAVYSDGTIYDLGINVNTEDVGVRPAMWVRIVV